MFIPVWRNASHVESPQLLAVALIRYSYNDFKVLAFEVYYSSSPSLSPVTRIYSKNPSLYDFRKLINISIEF